METLLVACAVLWLTLFFLFFMHGYTEALDMINVRCFLKPPPVRLTAAITPLIQKTNLPPIQYGVEINLHSAAAYGTNDLKKSYGIVIVGEKLFDLLSELELQCVLAHELSHIHNNDLVRFGIARSASIASTLTVAIGWIIVAIGFFAPQTPLVAAVITTGSALALFAVLSLCTAAASAAYSKYLEYAADRSAILRFGCNPDTCISALIKTKAILINDLFNGKKSFLGIDLNAHPTIEKRIAAIQALKC